MFKNIYTTRMSGSSRILEKRFEHISARPVKLKNLLIFVSLIVIVSSLSLNTLVIAKVTNENTNYSLYVTNNKGFIELQNKPFVENGEVYVPLRELFTKLGFMRHKDAKIEWNEGNILIYLVEENLNKNAASMYTSYAYKIEIGRNELVINPDELATMQKNYEFVEPMNLTPVLRGNVTYVPFPYAERIVERADNGIQSPPDRYDLEFVYSGDILSIAYPFDEEYDVTSIFGERVHPITGEKTLHSGMDIGVNIGTPVKAGIDGMVTDEGFDEDNGNFVVVKNDLGVEILYAHLNTIARHGAYAVKKGDIIGTSGNSGKSVGPHLHIEVKINGKYVNPDLYFEQNIYAEVFLDEVSDTFPRVFENCGYSDAEYEIKTYSVDGTNAYVEVELTNYENKTLTINYYKNFAGKWWLGAVFDGEDLILIT